MSSQMPIKGNFNIYKRQQRIPKWTAPGVDGATSDEAVKTFEVWADEMLT